MTTGGSDYYYHYGQVGSVIDVTNASGQAQWSYSYEPFGSMLNKTKVDPSAPENYMRFTGELYDKETDLYHLRARQYGTEVGRFTAIDPVWPSLTSSVVSPYSYVQNRPGFFTDPSGMVPLDQSNAPSGDIFDRYSVPLLGMEGKIYNGNGLLDLECHWYADHYACRVPDYGAQQGGRIYSSCVRHSQEAPLLFAGAGAVGGTIVAPGVGTAVGAMGGFSAGVVTAATSPAWCILPAAIGSGL